MKKIHKTILGISSLLALGACIAIAVIQMLPGREFNSLPIVICLVFCWLFLILYLITEYFFSKEIVLKNYPVLKKTLKITISILLIPLSIICFRKIVIPDKYTKRDVVYILPKNFKGEFTINYKTPKAIANEVIFSEKAISYQIPSSGVFNSPYPCYSNSITFFPIFYIKTDTGQTKIEYTSIFNFSSFNKNSVSDKGYQDNYWGSRDFESFAFESKNN